VNVQDPESPILRRNAETGCEMADVSLVETANSFMDHLVNLNREQRAYEVLLGVMLTDLRKEMKGAWVAELGVWTI